MTTNGTCPTNYSKVTPYRNGEQKKGGFSLRIPMLTGPSSSEQIDFRHPEVELPIPKARYIYANII